jgi:hypothetical protein
MEPAALLVDLRSVLSIPFSTEVILRAIMHCSAHSAGQDNAQNASVERHFDQSGETSNAA